MTEPIKETLEMKVRQVCEKMPELRQNFLRGYSMDMGTVHLCAPTDVAYAETAEYQIAAVRFEEHHMNPDFWHWRLAGHPSYDCCGRLRENWIDNTYKYLQQPGWSLPSITTRIEGGLSLYFRKKQDAKVYGFTQNNNEKMTLRDVRWNKENKRYYDAAPGAGEVSADGHAYALPALSQYRFVSLAPQGGNVVHVAWKNAAGEEVQGQEFDLDALLKSNRCYGASMSLKEE